MRPEVFPVARGVHCVRRASYLTCSYLVERPDGVVLVDAGMKTDGSDVLFALGVIGRRIEDVRRILLTHWHNDHAAGAEAIRAGSGASVHYAEAEAPWLLRQTASGGVAGWLSDAIPEAGPLVLAKGLLGSAPVRAVRADAFARPGDRLEGFLVIDTAGHTEGHLSFLYQPEGVLFAGDALAMVDGRLRFMARAVTPDLEAARASMRRCMDHDFEVVCAGHRAPGRVDAAERRRFVATLDEDGWPALG